MAQNKLKITYKGDDLVDTDISTATTKTLKTAGKYMEADVVVSAEGGSGGANYITFPLSYTGTDSFSYDYTGYKKTNMCPNQTTYYTGFSLGTVSGWGFNIDVYFTPYSANAGSFLASNDATGPALRLQVNGGKMFITGYFDRTLSNVGTVLINQENHIKLYCSGTGYKPPATVELNGTVIATGTRASTIASPTLHIGGNIQGGFDGEIRYVKIYDIRNDRLCFEAYGVKDTINDKQYVYMYSEDDPSYNGLHEPPSVWTSNKTYEDVVGFNPVSVNIPQDKIYLLGLGLSTWGGSIDSSGKLLKKTFPNVSSVSFDGLVSLGETYTLPYQWYGCQSVPSLYFNDLELVGQYSMQYTFANAKFKTDSNIVIDNLRGLSNYAFYYTFNSATGIDNVELGFQDNATLGTYVFYAFCYNASIKRYKVNNLKSITSSSAFYNAFGATSSKYFTATDVGFPDLETVNASSALYGVMQYRGISDVCVLNPFPKLRSVDGTNALSYAFRSFTFSNNINSQYVITFPKLETLGATDGYSFCSYLNNTNQGQWKYWWFPMLKTIGNTAATSTYQYFYNAFTGTTKAGLFELCMPELENILSASTSTTKTYGCFSTCTLLQKVWMPKLHNVSGKPNTANLFNAMTQSGLQIHFGIENETYIKGLEGYSTKFGATNATIYFDCVNHITVNGVVYNRDGEHYITKVCQGAVTGTITHPDDRYSWKDTNGNIIYTLECWTPVVGDNVYDENDNIVGTIGGIA